MVVGVLCLVALGFYEAYADLPLPIMPPKIFKKWREVTSIYVICFVGGMLYCEFPSFTIQPTIPLSYA
jgi:hypothetical protein